MVRPVEKTKAALRLILLVLAAGVVCFGQSAAAAETDDLNLLCVKGFDCALYGDACTPQATAAADTSTIAPNVNVTYNGNKMNPASLIVQDALKAQDATGVPAAVLLAQGAAESGDAGWWNKDKIDDAKAKKYSYFNDGGQKDLNDEFKSYDNNPNGHGPMQLDNWPGSYGAATGNYTDQRFDKFKKYAIQEFGAQNDLNPKKIGNIAMMFDTSILYAAIIDAELLPGGTKPANATSNQWVQVLDDYGTLRGADSSTRSQWKSLYKQIKGQLGDAATAAAAVADDSSSSNCCDGSQCCPTNGGNDSSDLPGKTPAEKAFNYLRSHLDLSPAAAAGVVGNLIAESGNIKSENLDTHAHNNIKGTHDGIAQWSTSRWAKLKKVEKDKDKVKKDEDLYDLAVQLDYLRYELNGDYKSVLAKLKNTSSPEDAAGIFNDNFEVSGDHSGGREANARKLYVKYKDNAVSQSSGDAASGSSGGGQDCNTASDSGSADLKKTITVDSPGKFITLPKHYSCPGHTTQIDSRIAADIAYLVDHYNLCANDGLASGHKSHGAGLAVDMVPRNGSSRSDWESSVQAAAKDMGWWGDGASDRKGSKSSCANYSGEGQCMHEIYPDKFPTWLRWLGYNGAFCHGDPWHVFGGCGAHIHIGWDTPKHDGVSPVVIDSPRKSVYAFPAPVPDDLKSLVGN